MNVYEKLSAIQTELKAPKNMYNKFGKYNYRNAEGIMEAVKPYLKEYKCYLLVKDDIEFIGSRYYIKATAILGDTESEAIVSTSALAREEETKKGMDGSQITGTASSYSRKYALNGLFILDDTKDADTDEYHEQTKGAPETPKEKAEAAYPSREEMLEVIVAKSDVPRLLEFWKVEKIEDATDAQIMALYNKAIQ